MSGIDFRPALKAWMISFLVFGLIAVALSGQFIWLFSMEPGTAARIIAGDLLPWAVFAPLIFALVKRWPIGRKHWRQAVPVHILMCVVTVALSAAWAEIVIFQPKGIPFEVNAPLPAEIERLVPPPPPGIFLFVFRTPIYLAIVSIAHALYFYRYSQERERKALSLEAILATARLEALKMQLQPHFLFNSLNAIAELVHKDPIAEKMVTALSDLLRLTLETSAEQELPLRLEMKFVERYLTIEQIRFGERLKVETRVAPEVLDALVPTFLLQPLVENAVRHGIESKPEEGTINITAWREDAALLIRIADTGAALPQIEEIREGVGIGNAKARLRELYGNDGTLDISRGGNTNVVVRVPFHTAS